MKYRPVHSLRIAAATYVVAGAALALVTLLCLHLELNIATTAVVIVFFVAALVIGALVGKTARRPEAPVSPRPSPQQNQVLNDQFRSIIDSIPALAWTALPDGSASFLNRRWLDYTGLGPDQARGWGWITAVHPDDVAALTERWRGYLAAGEAGEVEARLRRFDGEYRRFLLRAVPVRDAQGRVVKWYGTNVDIEDRTRMEDALRRSEAQLADAQRLSRTGSLVYVPSTQDLIWSKEAARIYDYDPAIRPMIDMILQRVHPDDTAFVLGEIDRASRGAQQFDLKHRLLMPDGSVRHLHVLAHAVRNEGGHEEIVGALRDITESKQAEDALRENEERFRDYAEISSDWLWESGPDHRFTHVSGRLKEVGIDPSSVIGKTRWESAVGVEDEPDKWRDHKAMLDAHRPFRGFTFKTARADGSPLYVTISGKPKLDVEGRFVGYRGVGTDITAAVRADQAERALHQAQAELAHVTRVTMLGELTASIAHEVNQPLAAIVANGDACLQWLDREPPDLRRARKSVESMVSNGDRASAVVRRIRTLSRNSAPQQTALNLDEVIGEVIGLVRREVINNGVSLKLELAPDLPAVLGDRVQLQQVIINLIINGIQAMAAVAGRQRELVIRSRQHDGHVLVEITDSGVGIDPNIANRLFDPFFTTKQGGMGMGLSVCRSLIEAHGGRIWASANDGSGATFQFTLSTGEGTPS